MTLIEVAAVIVAVLILLALFLPALAAAKKKSSKINCTNDLKQIGLACRIWEGDNGDMLPMRISTKNGGAMELVRMGNAVSVFQVMSNELSTPKILVCPSDTNSFYASNFSSLAGSNISYFVGVDVTNTVNPDQIFSGDCNFEIGGKPVKSGLVSIWKNDPVAWSAARHRRAGNLGFAFGNVEATTSHSLQSYFVQTGLATNRLAIP